MKRKVIIGLFLSLFIAACLAPLASTAPDALERVITDYRLQEQGANSVDFSSPLPDYSFPGITNSVLSTGLAGVTGTLMAFGGVYLLLKILVRGTKSGGNEGGI